ncbi:MAG: acetyl-CoA hydrolase/transferase C-terminal domain-containing protein [Pseudomonadota bacterium]
MSGKQAQHISAAEAAALVKNGDWVEYGVSIGQPDAFDAALAARVGELRGVKFRSCISARPRKVLEADPTGDSFTWFSWHFSGFDRKYGDKGLAHYMPINLGEIPDYYRRFLPPIDVTVLKVHPKDENGVYNFAGTGLWHRAVVECARTVIVEVNDRMPFAHGVENGIHESEVDFVIPGDGQAPPELPSAPLTDIDRAVGNLIAEQVPDGSCIQVGIGGMPNAVCDALLQSGVKDLGIHSEMLTDGMAALVRSGQVTGVQKGLDAGRHVYSFALGTQDLYDTLDGNADFCLYQADYTNLPHNIMKNPNAVAINNTTQIDLGGQAASESDGLRHLSGTGGQLQFVRGAYASPNGKSFMCLSSVYQKGDTRRSRIVLSLTPGNTVTTPRMDQMYVVTEYGCVNLKGQSWVDRARLLISIAHPDFREDLERQARDAGLVPKGYW